METPRTFDSVGTSVEGIAEAIAAVPENVHDGLGPNDPAALRAVFWAIDNLGIQTTVEMEPCQVTAQPRFWVEVTTNVLCL